MTVIATASTMHEKAPTRVYLAATDLADGLRQSWLWIALAQQDMKLRYRGSILGPFWQTLTTAVLITGLGFIYPKLFHLSEAEYLPMLSAGLVFWYFVSGVVTEGCKTFTETTHIIHSVKLPFSIHAYRVVYRNILTLAHNFVIVPIVLIVLPPPINWAQVPIIIPAFILVTINAVWISLLLGMISARYRDIPPIVLSITQLVLFVTPIFWQYQQLGKDGWWTQLNPMFAFVDVLRSPLVGTPTAPWSWPVLIGMTVGGGSLTFWFFAKFRHRLAFWV